MPNSHLECQARRHGKKRKKSVKPKSACSRGYPIPTKNSSLSSKKSCASTKAESCEKKPTGSLSSPAMVARKERRHLRAGGARRLGATRARRVPMKPEQQHAKRRRFLACQGFCTANGTGSFVRIVLDETATLLSLLHILRSKRHCKFREDCAVRLGGIEKKMSSCFSSAIITIISIMHATYTNINETRRIIQDSRQQVTHHPHHIHIDATYAIIEAIKMRWVAKNFWAP